jgi:predicted ArsR family transcriptional regulator
VVEASVAAAMSSENHRRSRLDVVSEPSPESVESTRHRALSDSSRLAILRVLEGAETPIDVRTLAAQVGLHINTVRWHLGILAEAGLVTEARESSGARGRPRHGYRIVAGALDDHPGGFRLLADVFAEVLARGGGAATIEAVGRERGGTLIADHADTTSPTSASAVAAIMRLLEQFGFQPHLRRARQGQRIDMRPCPFGDTAVNYSAVVCPLHLGLMRGALARLGNPLEATALEPFVKADLCVAHLAPAKHTRRTTK